jgi:ribosomal RNA-processing protein 12
MQKLSERAARRKAAHQQDGEPEDNGFDDLMESDEDDSDDGTLMTGATGFTRMTGRTGKSIRSAAIGKSVTGKSLAASTAMTSRTRKTENAVRLRAESNGEVMDMLDPKMTKNVRFAQDDYSDDSDSDSGVMEFDETGRLVVPDDDEDARGDETAVIGEAADELPSSKRRQVNKFESAKNARDEANKSKSRKKQVQSLGAAYKSKKAGGDVKKKGQKYEPYAFVPLDGKSYTKKNRRKTVEQMSTVVRQSGKRKR